METVSVDQAVVAEEEEEEEECAWAWLHKLL
jgi:hypothetical protein